MLLELIPATLIDPFAHGDVLQILLLSLLFGFALMRMGHAGFVTLAATLAVVPSIPVAGMTLILGIDRFMSECRSLTNFIGNAVATIVVSRWEGELDRDQLAAGLAAAAPMASAPAIERVPSD